MNELEKNTVPSFNQTYGSLFTNEVSDSDFTVFFIGNSITKHGYKADIGWFNDWGMAASAEAKDYVHLFCRRLDDEGHRTSYAIWQAADWERCCLDKAPGEFAAGYTDPFAGRKQPNLIIIRIIENVPWDSFNAEVFERAYGELVSTLQKLYSAPIILTTGFWEHPGDAAIRSVAQKLSLPCAELGDLGHRDDMKAVGLFEHEGVAQHPGDVGMQAITERIYETYKGLNK